MKHGDCQWGLDGTTEWLDGTTAGPLVWATIKRTRGLRGVATSPL